ncbi:antibiotic biosynthesis monooxygenase family protein [Tamlana crocina]|uniref:Antibiotic biosynthesis monooxygenase n=1 Tax=Tamlana crocina TaxID=393006 RepID=A0ABX1DEW7_9FLAO|nr:antibiotic biosynthesis monooxygenase [Tamlana crocina]NJX16279.1 antibiotic biosynthesis monooxygenase [Tamlana crocina]
MIAQTPTPPYYVVIFTSVKNEDDKGYSEMADFMDKLASQQDGFLGIETARNDLGITVSYWRDADAIKKWKAHTDHQMAQKKGKTDWYKQYKVRIAKVERDYDFGL